MKMCFHSNRHPWATKHPFISLYSKYQFLKLICLPVMSSPVFPSLDYIFCTSSQIPPPFNLAPFFFQILRIFKSGKNCLSPALLSVCFSRKFWPTWICCCTWTRTFSFSSPSPIFGVTFPSSILVNWRHSRPNMRTKPWDGRRITIHWNSCILCVLLCPV